MRFVHKAFAYTRWTLHYFGTHQSRRQHEKLIEYIARFRVQSTSRTPSSIRRKSIDFHSALRRLVKTFVRSYRQRNRGLCRCDYADSDPRALPISKGSKRCKVARWISTCNPWSRKTKHSERSRNRVLCRLRSFQKFDIYIRLRWHLMISQWQYIFSFTIYIFHRKVRHASIILEKNYSRSDMLKKESYNFIIILIVLNKLTNWEYSI